MTTPSRIDPPTTTRARRRAVLSALLAVFLVTDLAAQEERDRSFEWLEKWNPLDKGFRPDGDLLPIEYSVDEHGRLGIWPSPSAGGSTIKPEIVYRGQGLIGLRLGFLGPAGYFGLLFQPDRDFLSATNAAHHFRKLDLGTTDVALRRRIALTPSNENPALRRREHLDRLLAIRLVEARRLQTAKGELLQILKDDKADPFLRAAANDALRVIAPESAEKRAASAAPKPAATLLAMPAEFDAVFRIEHARMPPVPGLMNLARTAFLARCLRDMRAAGGTVSPAEYAGAHMLADQSTTAVYEIVRRFGNARLGRTTVAIQFDQNENARFWARVDGHFEADRIAAGLARDGGVTQDTKAGKTRGSIRRWRLEFELTRRSLTVWSEGYPLQKKGVAAERLLAGGFGGDSALWARVETTRRLPLLDGFEVPFVKGLTLRADVTKPGGFVAVVDSTDAADAAGHTTAKTAIRRSLDRVAAHPKPGFHVFRPLARRVKIEADGDKRLRVSLDPGKVTVSSLLRSLRRGR